jgi:hypothetical protein
MPTVEEFTAALARGVAAGTDSWCLDQPGNPGQRLVLLVDRLARMHLPGTVGRCPDCRLTPDGRPCMTWTVLSETLTSVDDAGLGRAFGRLLSRYAEPEVPAEVGT